MIRRVAVLGCLYAIGLTPTVFGAQAQTHPPHPQTGSHDPATHLPMDPALHDAIHAALLGDWTGTLTSPSTGQTAVHLGISRDAHGKMLISMGADQKLKFGSAADITTDDDALHWTQPVAGLACEASIAKPETHQVPETATGVLTCEHTQMTFALHRIKH